MLKVHAPETSNVAVLEVCRGAGAVCVAGHKVLHAALCILCAYRERLLVSWDCWPPPPSHSTEGCSPSTQAQSCAMKHILRAGISTSEPLVLADNVQSHVLLVCFDESSGKPQLVIKPSQQQQHQQLYQAVRLLRFVPGCVLGCDRPLVCSFWWRKDAG